MRIVPIGISILEEAERKPVDVCFGSWLRENVLAGADTSEHQLPNSGTGKTCPVLAITSWNRLYRLPGRCERSGGGVGNMGAPMPSPPPRIAAIGGGTPTMVMTQVEL